MVEQVREQPGGGQSGQNGQCSLFEFSGGNCQAGYYAQATRCLATSLPVRQDPWQTASYIAAAIIDGRPIPTLSLLAENNKLHAHHNLDTATTMHTKCTQFHHGSTYNQNCLQLDHCHDLAPSWFYKLSSTSSHLRRSLFFVLKSKNICFEPQNLSENGIDFT